jgi:hypothetical protein
VEFRALIWQSGLLRVEHPRSVPSGQHALQMRRRRRVMQKPIEKQWFGD